MHKSQPKQKNKHLLFNILQCSFTIVGTVVGAGFSSGKEISTFIGIYNSFFLLATILFSVLFCMGLIFCFYSTMITPTKAVKNILTCAIFICNFISFTAMLSALRSSIEMISTCQIWYILCLILTYLVIIFGINGLNKSNLVLIPLLIFMLVFMGVLGIKNNNILDTFVMQTNTINLIFSIPMYIGLNLYSVYPVTIELAQIVNKRGQVWTSIIASTTIMLLILSCGATVLNAGTCASQAELPLLYYASIVHPNLFIACVIALTIAIITTICSNGFILLNTLKNKIKKRKLTLLALFLISIPLSYIGFSNIVKYLYPISGAIGIVALILIFADNIYQRININKKKT